MGMILSLSLPQTLCSVPPQSIEQQAAPAHHRQWIRVLLIFEFEFIFYKSLHPVIFFHHQCVCITGHGRAAAAI
jgi:hypothetical protein